jgi:sugar/nucleoside kinase (ribokinase family)
VFCWAFTEEAVDGKVDLPDITGSTASHIEQPILSSYTNEADQTHVSQMSIENEDDAMRNFLSESNATGFPVVLLLNFDRFKLDPL